MKIAYIAHPIGGDVQGNLKKIRAIVRSINLNEPRVTPFAPYVADVESLNDDDPKERARGFKNNYAYFRKGMVDELRVYGDHISPGVQNEIDMARQHGVPIVYYKQERIEPASEEFQDTLKVEKRAERRATQMLGTLKGIFERWDDRSHEDFVAYMQSEVIPFLNGQTEMASH